MTYTRQLLQIISHSSTQFKMMTEDEWSYKPGPAKWSKKEILGHLIDSCHSNTRRMIVTQYEQNQVILYKQNEWVQYQDYQSLPYQHIIQLWQLMNTQLTSTIANIPESKLQYTCITDEPRSLEWHIRDYIRHLNHHLSQIKEKLHLQHDQ
ncbi:MAG: DinB family protein [Chitinophagaceae bacterium]|nr:DinB family protein [Chitinophagaceae bacterium]